MNNKVDYQQVIAELIKFRDDRNWQKYHNLKNLAESLNLEASEVLEIFQWKPEGQQLDDAEVDHLKEELADTLIYSFYMCEKLGVDPLEIVQKKVDFNQKRHWKIDD
ncbi:nucleotide pyrophosphohydrolase [Loigolactobacillus iwatensis]|uniref:nucleotide pyrophosphohydrolase n=1 Tax=Loigolactobacillus iwatensis TaxID=1267156 RepID=UPI000F7E3C78|nr:nucleotide pyrophosphohydrolase [Loigolactobacillus iwatensis]